MAFRLDTGSLRPPKRLPDGRLRVDGHLTRSGVFEYVNPDGTRRREYRPDSEVFDPASLATFASSIVTDDHPPTLVTALNARQHAVGMVGETIRRDGDHVAATLTINDQATIIKLEQGKVQLSCGYECDLDPTPGIAPNGERYDAIQRNIRGNHVAIVAVGRAGPTARLRMDAACQITPGAKMIDPDKAKDLQTALDNALAQVATEKKRADEAQAATVAAVRRADAAEGDRDALRVKVQALESERRDEAGADELRSTIRGLTARVAQAEARADAAEAPARLAAAVKARVALEAAAGAVMGERFDAAPLTDREVRCVVIQKLHAIDLSDPKHSDDYVRARFDSAVEGWQLGADALARASAQNRADRSEAPKKSPRDQMIERNQNAWRKDAS